MTEAERDLLIQIAKVLLYANNGRLPDDYLDQLRWAIGAVEDDDDGSM